MNYMNETNGCGNGLRPWALSVSHLAPDLRASKLAKGTKGLENSGLH